MKKLQKLVIIAVMGMVLNLGIASAVYAADEDMPWSSAVTSEKMVVQSVTGDEDMPW